MSGRVSATMSRTAVLAVTVMALLMQLVVPALATASALDITPSQFTEGFGGHVGVYVYGDTASWGPSTTVEIYDDMGDVAGDGVSNVDVMSSNDIYFDLPDLPIGDYDLVIDTDGTMDTGVIAVVPPQPQLDIDPSFLAVGYAGPVAIQATGTLTTWGATTTVEITDGDLVNLSPVATVTSPTELTFDVPDGLTESYYTVIIASDNETVSTGLQIETPYIDVYPSYFTEGFGGRSGVEVYGVYTTWDPSTTTVEIYDDMGAVAGGGTSNVDVMDPSYLTVDLPDLPIGDYDLVVDTNGSEQSATITVAPPQPQLAIDPSVLRPGYAGPVTIQATGTHTTWGATTTVEITDGDLVNLSPVVTVTSPTELTFDVPDGLTESYYTVIIASDNETVYAELQVATPYISINPSYFTEGFGGYAGVYVYGDGTSWGPTTTVEVYDDMGDVAGGGVSGVDVMSSEEFYFDLPDLPVGDYDLVIDTDGVIETGAITVAPPQPQLDLDPSFLAVGYAGPVTIQATGTLTTWGATTTVEITDGDLVNLSPAAAVSSETELTFDVPAGLDAGYYTVIITSDNETVSTGLQIETPFIDVYPSYFTEGFGGYAGVEVYGYYTSWDPSSTTVEIYDDMGDVAGDGVSNVDVGDSEYLTFDLPDLPIGDYDLVVDTSGSVQSATMTVSAPQPQLNIDPSFLAVGYAGPVTIQATGTLTTWDANTTVEVTNYGDVYLTPTPAVSSSTDLTFDVPAGLDAGYYTVIITSDNETVSTDLQIETPYINWINPSYFTEGFGGYAGVEVYGYYTSWDPSSTTVEVYDDMGDVAGDGVSNVDVMDLEYLTFDLPDLPLGSYDLVVDTNGSVQSATITVAPPQPQLDLDPSVLPEGYAGPVTIQATGTFTTWDESTTVEVTNDDDVTLTPTLTLTSPTDATFEVPGGLAVGYYDVYIASDNETVYGSLQVEAPYIWINPSYLTEGFGGYAGVEVYGYNTSWDPSTTTVEIYDDMGDVAGDGVSNVDVMDPTFLTFDLPDLPLGTYDLVVETNGSVQSATITVAVQQPYVSSIDPDPIAGNASLPTLVTLTGVVTNWQDGVTTVTLLTDGSPAGGIANVSVALPTELTFDLTVNLDPYRNHSFEVETNGDYEYAYPNVEQVEILYICCAPFVVGYATPRLVDVYATGTMFDAGTTVEVQDTTGVAQVGAVGDVAVHGSTSLTFELLTSLPVGQYDIVIDPGPSEIRTDILSSGWGIEVVDGAIEYLDPGSLPAGYVSPVQITAYGVGTSWDGTTTVRLREVGGPDVPNAVSNVAVTTPTELSFDLDAQLAPGSGYEVVVTTGGSEQVAWINVDPPSASLDPRVLTVGYAGPVTIQAQGQATTWDAATSVEVSDNDMVNLSLTPTVTSATELSFELPAGLAEGGYLVTISGRDEVVRSYIEVAAQFLEVYPVAIDAFLPPPVPLYFYTYPAPFSAATSLRLLDDDDVEVANAFANVAFDAGNPQDLHAELTVSLPQGEYTIEATTDGRVDTTPFQVRPGSVCSPRDPADNVTDTTGLTNVGFETGDLTGWTTGFVNQTVGVSGTDAWTSPFEGASMGVLGTPPAIDHDTDSESVDRGLNELCQDIVVDEATEQFVYRVFSMDASPGEDQFAITATVVSPATGQVLASTSQSSWTSAPGVRSTPWTLVSLDLSAHMGETVRLLLSVDEQDGYSPFWAYIDSAEVSQPLPVATRLTTTSATGSRMVDPETGTVTIVMPRGNPSDLGLTYDPDCDPGPATSVTVLLDGVSHAMTPVGDGTWTVTILAGELVSGDLTVVVDCNGTTTTEELGRIELIDPSGYLTDLITGDPVEGAAVYLHRVPGWEAKVDENDMRPDTCQSPASKDPSDPYDQPAPTDLGVLLDDDDTSISPNVQPFLSDPTGFYGWLVSPGCYYVIVEADGYETLTSPVVGVPPEVTDLDLVLTPIDETAPSFGASPTIEFDNVTTTSFDVTWSAATDAFGVTSYEVIVDTAVAATVSGLDTSATISGLDDGTEYAVSIVAVDDADNRSADGPSDSVTTLVANIAPTADAGGPYSADEGGSVALDGSASSDPDDGIVSYAWDFDTDGLFDDATGATPTFSAAALDGPTSVQVRLRVTDDSGDTGTSIATVTVANVAPTADAGGPYAVDEGGTVALGATATDPASADTITFTWDLDGDTVFGETGADATRGDETGATPTFDAAGIVGGTVVTVAVRATDDDGGVGSDTADVEVGGVAPTADAGGPYSVNEGGSVALAGSGSDPVDETLDYAWDLDDDGDFDDATGATPTFSAAALDGPATLTVTLQVTDDSGDTGTSIATVTVANVAPTADAGGPYAVDEGGTVALGATATDPASADTITFVWDLDGDTVFGETGTDATRGDEIGADVTFVAPSVDVDTDVMVALRVSDGTDTTSDTGTISIADIPETGGENVTPSWPTDAELRPSNITATEVTIAWDAVANDDTGVTAWVARASAPDGRRAHLDERVLGFGTTTTTWTGLEAATTYTFSVQARDDDGAESSDGPTLQVTTLDPTPDGVGVERLSGPDRYATAASLALSRFNPSNVDHIYVATGENFPDALAAGPLAAQQGVPILLTQKGVLPDATRQALQALGPFDVTVLGGTTAVDDAVVASIRAALPGVNVGRLAGEDRYDTATLVADNLAALVGAPAVAYLAIGTNFPDAVAGGPATNGAPILLTNGQFVPEATRLWLERSRPARIVALGGSAVLSDTVLATAASMSGATDTARLFGPNRFATATAIAATIPSPDTVYVAVGTNFPDALSAGPAAAAEGAPIVLAAGGATSLPPETKAYLDSLSGLRRIVVVGGQAVVTDQVFAELQAILSPPALLADR